MAGLSDFCLQSTRIRVDGRDYSIHFRRARVQPLHAPRLLVVSHLPTEASRSLLDVCLRSIERHTAQPHETWVVDNNSPWPMARWLLEHPDLNVVLNRTEPIPSQKRGWRSLLSRGAQRKWGSYANAIGLELGVRAVDADTRHLAVLHMDAAPCHSGWLPYLQSKLVGRTAAAGVRMERRRTPDGVLHVLGFLVDFQLFRRLGLDFMPDMPRHDVGDRVTLGLRSAGYEVFACENTHKHPELVARIPASSPFRHLHVDRSLDDEGRVIFLHLGRGVAKSAGSETAGVSPEEWIALAEKHLLA